MKRKLHLPLLLSFILAGIIAVVFLFNKEQQLPEKTTDDITELRKKHEEFLKNSPFKETRWLSKKERKARALPPNGFFEQEWDRTLDPNLGYPNFRKALQIQYEQIEKNKKRVIEFGVPGESVANPWVEQGPNNVGGRTRAIMFDPNDPTNRRVFAGGVSGGLWVNNDITNGDSVWQLVTGVPENIAVTQIVFDPNNTDIFYIGSGESYTNGDAVGNGVYRSIDGGVNWEMIFGGPQGTSIVNQAGTQVNVNGILYVNDIITRNVSGSTEIYFSAAVALFAEGGGPVGALGINERGVYRSINNGDSWTQLTINSPSTGQAVNPNDLELDINNNIWMATGQAFGLAPSGEIYRSNDGITFTFVNNIPNAARTEIEPSQQDANVFYIAANVNGQADLFFTTTAFVAINQLNEPNDVDTGISANDYANGQAFYNLPIEVDPNDDTILYVGGIDLFRATVNRATASAQWRQISRWVIARGLENLDVSVVHADQHAIVFNPTNSNEILFGTDGGVYYTPDISTATSPPDISARNNGYAVTQFYAGDINDATGNIGGGTQDNGTPYNFNPTNNIDPFFAIIGGDGAYGQFDDEGQYFIGSTQFINYIYFELPIQASSLSNSSFIGVPLANVTSTSYTITDIDGGNFINEADVDTNLDILYINAINGGASRIGRYSNITNGPANINETFLTNPLLSGVISSLQTSPYESNSTRLLVGTENSRILNVDNADGDNPVWTDISGAGFLGNISDIEFGMNSQTIMATISNYGVASVWYTENGGTTWVSKEGDLPDIPVFAILQNPLNPNEAIVGTQFGVWRTENFLDVSPNWLQSFNGMSNVPVRDLDLRPSTNEVLAVTHGRGMFTGSFTIDPNEDNDGDGVLNGVDNCPNTPNADQADSDGDGVGDVCQDTDFDGIVDINDNCPDIANPDQADADGDGEGDVCEDADGDGVIDVEDNCPNTPNPDQADGDGDGIGDVCDDGFLAQDNLDVETVSETCPGLDNGTINVTVNETGLPYAANLVGNGLDITQNFTETTSFVDLPVGAYVICVSLTDRDFERCFEVNIDAAAPLDIDFEGVLPGATENSAIYSFNVNFGEGPFEIRFNDELIRRTNETSFDIELTGSGTLEIIPARLCQGIFSLAIDTPGVNEIRAFPNPVVNELTVSIPGGVNTVSVSVFSITGQLVYQQNSNVNGNSISVPFGNVPSGIYFVRLDMDNPVVLKIVK